MIVLPQDFYFGETTQIAKDLLGKVLHIKTTGEEFRARIVEVEAYTGIQDPAAHSYGDKKTNRTKSMYKEGGHSYVYMIYGMYFCLNFVTNSAEQPEAILIRGVEPLPAHTNPKKKDLTTNGPGKLCRHYQIDKSHDGIRLWKRNSFLWVSDDSFKVSTKQIIACPRIGVDYAGDAALWPYRYYLRDNPWVSRK